MSCPLRNGICLGINVYRVYKEWAKSRGQFSRGFSASVHLFANSVWHLEAEEGLYAVLHTSSLLSLYISLSIFFCSHSGGQEPMNHMGQERGLSSTRPLQHDNFLLRPAYKYLTWLMLSRQSASEWPFYLATCFTAIGQSAAAAKIHSIDRSLYLLYNSPAGNPWWQIISAPVFDWCFDVSNLQGHTRWTGPSFINSPLLAHRTSKTFSHIVV